MTVPEYYRAAQTGVFGPDERLELIHGQVIKMSPPGSLHAAVVSMLRKALEAHYKDAEIRDLSPLALDSMNEPEPDIVVARGAATSYLARHPSPADVILVVEVADSSLRKDRKLKTALYAQYQVPEYWIVDLTSRRVEVFREPEEDAAGTWRHRRSDRFSNSDEIRLSGEQGGLLSLAFLAPAK